MFLAVSSSYYSNNDLFRSSSSSAADIGVGIVIWTIIAVILAVIGGILLYTLFLNKKNEGKFKGFAGWLYDFLSFKTMSIEVILKVLYLISAIFVTLYSFTFLAMGSYFWMFFVWLILGNLAARVGYELMLITIMIWRNTTDIRKSLKK